MKTTATPHSHAAEFIKDLERLDFKPGAFDNPNKRTLVKRNQAGHITLRVRIAYEGQSRPQDISLIKLNGQANQLTEWESLHLSAHMPSKGLLALIKALAAVRT